MYCFFGIHGGWKITFVVCSLTNFFINPDYGVTKRDVRVVVMKYSYEELINNTQIRFIDSESKKQTKARRNLKKISIHEDGNSIFLRNVGIYIRIHTAS